MTSQNLWCEKRPKTKTKTKTAHLQPNWFETDFHAEQETQ